MAKLIYQHPGDDLAKLYAPALADGSVDPNYPLAHLSNDAPALPAKFTANHLRLVWDLEDARLVELPVFSHWNVRAPATAFFEANATDAWTSPSLSTAIPLTTANGLGYWPFPFLDRSGLPAYRYVSLVIADNPANVVIGGIWLGAVKRSLVHNPSWGVQFPRGQETVIHRTNFDVEHAFTRAVTGGVRNGNIETTLAGFEALQAWGEACGWRARPVPIIVDPAINRASFVRWDQDEIVPEPTSVSNVRVPVAWRDVAPGEAWP